MIKCLVCDKNFDDNHEFKKHVYWRHNFIQIRSVYNIDFESLVGGHYLHRLRSPVMKMIMDGHFLEWIKSLIVESDGGEYDQLDYTYPLSFDLDPVNS